MMTWDECLVWVKRWSPIALLVLLAVVSRLLYLSNTHLVQADAHFQAGEYDEALWDYQWALRHYVPGSPINRKALEGGLAIAAHWQQVQNTENERKTLRRLRGSLYAIRSVYQPFSDSLQSIETQLRDLGEPIDERHANEPDRP